MAIDLEVKHRLRELEERIRAQGEKISSLQSQVDSLVVSKIAPVLEAAKEPKVKLCPHCGEKPGYFFHVRSCAAKNSRAGG
jgi:cell division protein FtsL